jgi:transposase
MSRPRIIILIDALFSSRLSRYTIPASSGKTHRFRLNRGGNGQANAALYLGAIVRMRNQEPTLAYVKKRTKDGKRKSEIIRCPKRYIVREIYSRLCVTQTIKIAA